MERKYIRYLSLIGARGVLGQALLDMADDGKKFYAISADLAKASGFDRLCEKYPDTCINTGIAEQAMMGVAAGLSYLGTPVYATSWAVFSAMRVTDHMRNYMGGMKRNIKLIGLDSGLTKTEFGISHANPQDIAIFRSQPNVRIIAPSDGQMLYKMIQIIQHDDIPTYVRMTGGERLPVIYADDTKVEIGKAITLREGEEVAFLSTGVIINEVLKATEMLQDYGVSCTVIDFNTIKPLDVNCLEGIKEHKLIVTVEEHSIYAGFGSAVAEYFAQTDECPHMMIKGVSDIMLGVSTYEEALHYNGLDAETLFKDVMERLERINKA